MTCKSCGKEDGIFLQMPSGGFCQCTQVNLNPAWPNKFNEGKFETSYAGLEPIELLPNKFTDPFEDDQSLRAKINEIAEKVNILIGLKMEELKK